MRRIAGIALSSLLVAGAFAPATVVHGQDQTPLTVKPPANFKSLQRDSDLAAARALFEANLDAIRNHDRDAYLDCYWQNPAFTTNGPGGPSTRYADFAENVGDSWPEIFDASHMEFSWLRPGVVYGSYRYRVSFDGNESTGRSERVLMETDAGWRIAVSTAFPDPPGTPPPPVALVGGTLVPGPNAAPVPNATVVIRDGKIACAGSGCEIPGDAERVVVLNLWVVMGEVLQDPFARGALEEGAGSADGVGDDSAADSAAGSAAGTPAGGRPGGSAGVSTGASWQLTGKLGIPTEGEPANLLIVEKDPRQAVASSSPPFNDLHMVMRDGELRGAEEYRVRTGGQE